jgi:hypothetical protein
MIIPFEGRPSWSPVVHRRSAGARSHPSNHCSQPAARSWSISVPKVLFLGKWQRILMEVIVVVLVPPSRSVFHLIHRSCWRRHRRRRCYGWCQGVAALQMDERRRHVRGCQQGRMGLHLRWIQRSSCMPRDWSSMQDPIPSRHALRARPFSLDSFSPSPLQKQ